MLKRLAKTQCVHNFSIVFFTICVFVRSTMGQSVQPPAISLRAEKIADSLHSPTAIVFPDNGVIWVSEQTGQVRIINNGKLSGVPLLDLKSKMIKVNSGYEERGLLGLVLHPKFVTNHKFYVFYSAPSNPKMDHKGVVAEYRFVPGKDNIDPNSGRVILSIEEPEGNHNGGCLQFGPDGYLYISSGDGGGQHDKHGEIGNGQNLDTWLGKILRIDINTETGYRVPKDNPFVGKKGTSAEIWAYGFRNPYRISFDKKSGHLFAGEVGQDNWEEVDIVEKGANYGWRIVEGTHCHNPEKGCDLKGITMPIDEYSHKVGVSVIGGYVYNGSQIPVLKSKYIFADWSGPIFYLQNKASGWERGKILIQGTPALAKILGFGMDKTGEIYLLLNTDTGPENKNGSVYKIIK